MSIQKIEKLHKEITDSIMTINPVYTYDELPAKIIELCNVINETETDESVWYIGEHTEAMLSDLLIGAFWHYTEHHTGQFSDGYGVYCAISTIFSPGMTDGPEDGSQEQDVYDQLAELAEK